MSDTNNKIPNQVTPLHIFVRNVRESILKRAVDDTKLIDPFKISAMINSANLINLNKKRTNNLINFLKKSKISPQLIKENKNYQNLFNEVKTNFDNFCKITYLNNNFKFVYINYEKYNYTLIEYICLYNKGEKFSVLDFCTAIGIFIPHFCYHPDLSIAVIVECV